MDAKKDNQRLGVMVVVASAVAVVATAVALSLWAKQSAPPMLLEDIAWRLTCDLSRYDCRGVQQPEVVITHISGAGARGSYIPPMTAVFIDQAWSDFSDPDAMAILVHEMTHYLQGMNGLPRSDGNFISWCIVEGEAYETSNKYLDLVERPDLKYDWAGRCTAAPPVEAEAEAEADTET